MTCQRKRKKAAVADVEVNWAAYFESIKEACPWSRAAYKQDKIRILDWHSQILDLGTNEAIVYIAPKHKPRQLKKISDRLNRTHKEYEFLWSHPSFEYNSTPVPVIIQQDRKRLLLLRKKL